MYAVVASGGKQYRVTEGQLLDVELTGEVGSEIDLPVIMVVDGDTVLATPDQLQGSAVRAKVIGETKGPKVVGFTYKNKTNQRRRFGHRQRYSTLEISSIRKA
ncbi:MAG: 50S ribosomal protein L21 [Actinobacteria bacterium]|nr:MAG: 50S ribosomal protein L21 [Actinomycetota bacterium]